MLPFPKRWRQPSSVDLEDNDLVTVAHLDDSADLADTGVLPPKPAPARVLPPIAPPRIPSAPPAATAGSLAPVALSAPPLPRFGLPEDERDHTPGGVPVALADDARRAPVVAPPEPAWMKGRPSLPWAAVLVVVGAIASAASTKLLEAVDPHAPPVAAAAPPVTVSLPLTPPTPPKPGPVVLTFAPSDAVTVAVPAPNPVATFTAPTSPAPVTPPVAAPAPKPAPPPPSPPSAARKPVVAPPSSPAPSDSVRHATTIDSLADAQLKAVLK